MGGGGQDGWERRIEAFVKIQKKYFFWGGPGSGRGWSGDGSGGVGLRGQGGCERKSKVFVKIQKKKLRGGGLGRGRGGPIRGWGWGGCGSKVWGNWVMWGMGDVNQE